MLLKGKIRFDKQNLPPYVFKYNVALIAFFIGWFVLCFPPIIAVAYIYGESFETYATMIALFGLFAVVLLIFVIVAMQLRKRLVNDCVAKIEEEFTDMPLEEARAALKERGIITDEGYVVHEDVFGKRVVRFENAQYSVYAGLQPTGIKTYVAISDVTLKNMYEKIFSVDNALFNFLDKCNVIDYEDNRDFVFLKTDKKSFCQRALGFKIK